MKCFFGAALCLFLQCNLSWSLLTLLLCKSEGRGAITYPISARSITNSIITSTSITNYIHHYMSQNAI